MLAEHWHSCQVKSSFRQVGTVSERSLSREAAMHQDNLDRKKKKKTELIAESDQVWLGIMERWRALDHERAAR